MLKVKVTSHINIAGVGLCTLLRVVVDVEYHRNYYLELFYSWGW